MGLSQNNVSPNPSVSNFKEDRTMCLGRVSAEETNSPRPETSVAGTAMPDSGHDRAQRSQNPSITQNRT